MSLCCLMQLDFTDAIGRYDEAGQERYSDRDLAYGRQYALDYLSIGITHEPMRGFDLQAFTDWCEAQIVRAST